MAAALFAQGFGWGLFFYGSSFVCAWLWVGLFFYGGGFAFGRTFPLCGFHEDSGNFHNAVFSAVHPVPAIFYFQSGRVWGIMPLCILNFVELEAYL